MYKLGIAFVWFTVAAGLFLIEPELQRGNPAGSAVAFASYGKWIALAMGVMNLLRPSLLYAAGLWVARKIGVIPPLPKPDTSPPPKPVVRPDLDFTDDRVPDDRIEEAK